MIHIKASNSLKYNARTHEPNKLLFFTEKYRQREREKEKPYLKPIQFNEIVSAD